MAIGEAEKCLAGCQVTKCKFGKSSLLCSTSHLGAFDCWKNRVDMLVLGHYVLAMELWVHVSRLPVPHLDKTDGNILYLEFFSPSGG